MEFTCLETFSILTLLVSVAAKILPLIHIIYLLINSGHGLVLEHFRYNSDCDVYEELEPVDANLKYDFDYQQFTHLRREVIIKPVSHSFFYSFVEK